MIDGKQFFRQARSRLSYESFNAFLATTKLYSTDGYLAGAAPISMGMMQMQNTRESPSMGGMGGMLGGPMPSSSPGPMGAPMMEMSGQGAPTSPNMIDGKQFFRQARSRLSYESFNAFLANIKRLN